MAKLLAENAAAQATATTDAITKTFTQFSANFSAQFTAPRPAPSSQAPGPAPANQAPSSSADEAKRKHDEDALAAAEAQRKQAEAALLARATQDRDRQAAEQEVARTRALAEEAVERARALQLNLPPRGSAPDEERKVRGGAARLQGRTEVLARTALSRQDITQAEYDRWCEAFARGQQVNLDPSPAFALWGSGQAALKGPGEQPVQALRVLQSLQRSGMAPISAADADAMALQRVFKSLAEKEAKKSLLVKSFKDFHSYMAKNKLLTQSAHEEDPEAYWQMQWLFQSVMHLNLEHGWPVAQAYYKELVRLWSEGFLDLDTMVLSEDFRRGNIVGALHLPTFMMAISGKKASSGSGSGSGTTTGTTEKEDSTDTWCEEHQLFFPAERAHDTARCASRKARLNREKKKRKEQKKKKDKKDSDD